VFSWFLWKWVKNIEVWIWWIQVNWWCCCAELAWLEFRFWTMSFGCGIVWEKMRFLSKSHFKCYCEINDFGEIGLSWFRIGKKDFTVECDMFKWLERVRENIIENGSTIKILCAKRRKRKIGKILCCHTSTTVRHTGTGHANGLHLVRMTMRPSGITMCVMQVPENPIFRVFRDFPIFLWVSNTEPYLIEV